MIPAALVLLGVLAQANPRSEELVHQRCVSDLAVTEVTLFGNGTLRLREQLDERRDMLLAELNRDELDAFLTRLGEIDLLETRSVRDGVDGEWVGQCSIRLRLAGRPERFFRYGGFDSLSLGLHALGRVVADLEELARARSEHGNLPDGYEPTSGDFVRRRDGAIFEIVGYTSDNRGVELTGLDQPITIYVSVDDFRSVFVALEDASLIDIDF